jgi:hypothetical protein
MLTINAHFNQPKLKKNIFPLEENLKNFPIKISTLYKSTT